MAHIDGYCFELPEEDKRIIVVNADITKLKVDAIVNPANSMMMMGGGVAGAIKRAGGQEIEDEAVRHAPVPVGDAVHTGAGRLPARYVIHAPTMEQPAMRINLDKAAQATVAALVKALDLGVKSIAIPAMGAGVGGLDPEDVFKVMAEIVNACEFRGDIVFVAWGEDAYRKAIKAVREATGVEGRPCTVDLLVSASQSQEAAASGSHSEFSRRLSVRESR